MKNKKGFTLVELLVVIAILAILAIVATPRILDLFNDAKKNAFLIDVKGLYKAATQKYMSESLKGNKVTDFSSGGDNKLDLDNDDLEYYIEMDDKGKVTHMVVTNGEYSIETYESDPSSLDKDDVSEEKIDINIRPNTDPIQNIPSTTSYLDKTKFQNFVKNNSPTEIYFTISGHSTGTDISNDPTEPIYAWMEGTKMYVSAREPNKKVSAPVDSSYLFSGSSWFCEKFQAVSTIDVTNLDTSKVTNMSYMFEYTGYNATRFELNLSNWNTSNVTNMSYMFYNAGRNATTWSIGDLSSWDTSKVTNMSGMFTIAGYYVTTWSIGDLSGWDTSKVTDMSGMFYMAGRNATTFKLNLGNWDTSKVTNMSAMFYFAGENATTFNLDISNWDTSKVTDMSTDLSGMFSNAGHNASTFEIKIPKRSNGTADNTATSLKGLSTSAPPPSGKSFTLVN